jgi:hypothetical protein
MHQGELAGVQHQPGSVIEVSVEPIADDRVSDGACRWTRNWCERPVTGLSSSRVPLAAEPALESSRHCVTAWLCRPPDRRSGAADSANRPAAAGRWTRCCTPTVPWTISDVAASTPRRSAKARLSCRCTSRDRANKQHARGGHVEPMHDQGLRPTLPKSRLSAQSCSSTGRPGTDGSPAGLSTTTHRFIDVESFQGRCCRIYSWALQARSSAG